MFALTEPAARISCAAIPSSGLFANAARASVRASVRATSSRKSAERYASSFQITSYVTAREHFSSHSTCSAEASSRPMENTGPSPTLHSHRSLPPRSQTPPASRAVKRRPPSALRAPLNAVRLSPLISFPPYAFRLSFRSRGSPLLLVLQRLH